ncbi:MMPL family transporter [Marinitoga sp. 38H-ov]|uniref:efflux RND transporter permease subunit n=1 Tax=Marinitoga sp. 38H-ov TaxID=1755814 RepID=UPI0013ECFADC|nr:MMPL family transporter [Marinitoga sp. 38H-ov]KAF2955918.1 hypothetical protein AS160_08105 [Marinitoga sp. 38H-ov]
MSKLSSFIFKNSKIIFLLLTVITIISIYLISKLEIRPGFLDLLPSNDSYVEVYEEAINEFKSIDSIIIGIEGNRENIIDYIENISLKLKNIEYIDYVYYKNPIEFISKNIFLLSQERDQKILKELYSSTNLEEFFKAINVMFTEPENGFKIHESEKKQFEYMLNSFENLLYSIENIDEEGINKNLKSMLFGEEYLLSKDGTFGMIIIRPTINSNDIEKVVYLVNKIENLIKSESKNYNVKAGLSGTLVIARDEMVVTERDMLIATSVSIILILIIFILGFRSLRYMILAVIPLILGIIWALGFAKITIGSLNIMTVMMGAILAGLGIDYSIHIISLFIELRKNGLSVKESLVGVFEKNIRGVIAGAVTTAIGMGIFSISSFPGFREFGIVLSSGIILTLLASIFGLTILLKKFGDKYKDPGNFFVVDYNIKKYRVISLILFFVLLSISLVKINNIEFDKNMMNIEAKGLESIKLNEKILEKFEFSPDNTIFISNDLSEAKILYNELKELTIFSEIDSIVNYIPETESQVIGLSISNEIKNKEYIEKDIGNIKSEINNLNFSLTKTALSLNLIGQKDLGDNLNGIVKNGVLLRIANKSVEDLKKIQKAILDTLKDMRGNLNTNSIITFENIPYEIKNNYVGESGKLLTTAYTNGDIWNVDFQKEYFNSLEKLNFNNVSGTALIFLRVIQISSKEGIKVLLLTILFIFIVLLLDLKSLKYAILSLLPMLLSIILLLGVMGWFNIKFNVVNIIALPLIIGIGVDDGIHFIHRYKKEKDLRSSLKSTGKAITMTTLTTGAAFGSFILSKYRGFIGFGLLLLLGVIFSYLITVFVVTSILSYLEEEK